MFKEVLTANNIPTFISTFITSILAVMIYNKMMKISTIPAFSSFISSTFIAIIGVILTQLNILPTPAMLVVCN